MAVLVAGGAGYIGSHTAVELINQGFDVIIADNFSNSRREAIDCIELITGTRPELVTADLTDPSQVSSVFCGRDIESVINFAAFKSIGESVERPLMYYDNNIRVTVNLCRAMEEYGVDRMIFSSSATVYGNGSSPMAEGMLPQRRLSILTAKRSACAKGYLLTSAGQTVQRTYAF